MNFGTFNSLLIPYFEGNLPKDSEDAANAITNAYHLANIGQTKTMYGAPMISADKSFVKTFVKLGLDINFYGGKIQATVSSIIASILGAAQVIKSGSNVGLGDTEKFVRKQVQSLVPSLPPPLAFLGGILSGLISSIFSELNGLVGKTTSFSDGLIKSIKKLQGIVDLLDVTAIAYITMATGFCLYWLTAKFSPMPPMPPCIAPTGGPLVLFPGLPVPLNSALKDCFKAPQSPSQAILKLSTAMNLHHLTIFGIFTGMLPTVPFPIPSPPIPWFSLLP
jgi:hypothetical protein